MPQAHFYEINVIHISVRNITFSLKNTKEYESLTG